MRRLGVVILAVAIASVPALAAAGGRARESRRSLVEDPVFGGSVEAVEDGSVVRLPLARTEMEAQLAGDLATVRLTQTFENPLRTHVNARYVFPLPENAAVHAMRLTTADEVIQAEIREAVRAKAEFQKAKEEGKQAALLTQHRPNVFTQEVANLKPGSSVKVELTYVHVVPKRDGDYQFVFPMVVGPRYLPEPAKAAEGEPAPLAVGAWNLPASAPVAAGIDPEQVGLEVRIAAGLPVRFVDSPSHELAIAEPSPKERVVRLAAGRTIANRDFVLRYRLAGDAPAAGATTWADGSAGVVSLLVEPPTTAPAAAITPRELVFVLDCSGSMSGPPLEASKRFMRRSLKNLKPTDAFRIIRFSDGATSFSKTPLPATSENVARGLAYVEGLDSEGGTEMSSGIRAALDAPGLPGHLRLVVFLTDGYIGNDVEVVRLVSAKLRDARLFSFGVGTGVNRYLLQELARAGRGVARIVLPGQDEDEAADLLANRLEAPYLTDVTIDWGGAKVREVTPKALPDLFLGESVRVLARYDRPGAYRVTVHGNVAGQPVQLPLDVLLPARAEAAQALPVVWARSQIEDRMIDYAAPTTGEDGRRGLQAEVTELGLTHRLVTQWTSFVAVGRKVVNPGGAAANGDVQVAQVEGVTQRAYPPGAVPGTGFVGHAAPEPVTWAAAGLMAALAARAIRRRRQQRNAPWPKS